MPKYILCSGDFVDAPSLVPDMRNMPKQCVTDMAQTLRKMFDLPDCVGVRALLRTSDVAVCGSRVIIDDDAVVLRPPQRTQFRRELVTRCLSDVE